MDTTTSYMGIQLPNPFIAGVPLQWDTLDIVRQVEDAGGAAIVLPPLFEEELQKEALATHFSTESHAHFFAEAMSFFADHEDFVLGPEEYLEHIRKLKEAVNIPIIASLNGNTMLGWKDYAKLIEQAEPDALELDFYYVPTDVEESGEAIEQIGVNIVTEVREAIKLPLGVKLSPFFTSLAHFAGRLERVGADGIVIFNRFYEADIDVEELEVVSRPSLSFHGELLLRLRWLALLSGNVNCSLAATGGVHTAVDAVKAVMAGANVVQMVSILKKRGFEYLTQIRQEFAEWLERHEYESLEQMHGSMNIRRCPDPEMFQRINYMYIMQTW